MFVAVSSRRPSGSANVLAPHPIVTAILFSLAALSKETAIITPVALALWEAFLSPATASSAST